jgi:alpha-D-xyloside xylohydrolase
MYRLGRFSALPLLFAIAVGLQSAGQDIHVSQISDGILVKTAKDQLHIAVCAPGLLHVTAGPESAKPSSPHQPWIVQECAGGKFTLEQADKAATLKTQQLQVKIGLDTGGLTFQDGSGHPLLTEGIWSPFSTRRYNPVRDGLFSVLDMFQIPEDEGIYGLGQHQSGVLNYRGLNVSLGQNNTDVAVPLLISTRGYGVLWNTAAQSSVNNQFPRSLIFSAESAEGLDYYFIYGPEPDQIIHQYRELTGHAPLFGKWAYGFFQSKDRYKTQDELVGIVDQYRSRHIPLDTVIQDWQWWTKWGSSDFNTSYPDFAGAVNKDA